MNFFRSWYRWVTLIGFAILVGMQTGCSSDITTKSHTESLNIYEIWATKASFTEIAGDETASKFQLILSNQFTEDDAILYFTNRGAQQAGTRTLGDLINNIWPRVYGSVAPNALLQGKTAANETVYISCIIEKPVLNKATGQLSFSITYLDGRRPEASLALTDLELIITNNSATVQPAVWSHNLDGATGTLEPAQNADGAVIDGTYTFHLQKAFESVLGMACAPQRKTETIATKSYFDGWNTRFGTNPPNVSISYTDSSLMADGGVFTATLSNPVYDENTGSVSFTAKNVYSPLMPIGKTAVTLQAPSVFIDAGPGGFPTFTGNVFSIQYRNSTTSDVSVWFDGTQPPCSKAMSDKCVVTGTPDTYENQWRQLSADRVFEKSGTYMYITKSDGKTTRQIDTKKEPIVNHIELAPGETLRVVPPVVNGYPQWYFNNGTTAGVAAWVTKKAVSMPAIMKITKFEYNLDPNHKIWADMGGVDGINVNATMTLEGPGCGDDVNCGTGVMMPRSCKTNLTAYKDSNDGCPYISKTGEATVCANPNQYPVDGDINAQKLYPNWVVAQNKLSTDKVESDYPAEYGAATLAWIFKMQSIMKYDFGGRAMASAPVPIENSDNLLSIKNLKVAYHIWWATNPAGQGWINYLQKNKNGMCDQYGWAFDEKKWKPGDTFNDDGNPPDNKAITPLWHTDMKKDTYLNIDILKIL